MDPVIAKLSFLVADDTDMFRSLCEKALKDHGATKVISAVDGMEAWTKLARKLSEKEPVDIVISDWNMPRLSGLDLLRRCRKDPAFQKIGFILVTTVSELKQVKVAVEEGVDSYLVKPFQEKDLAAKVSEVIGKKFKNR